MMRAGRLSLGDEHGGLHLGFTDWGDPEASRTVVCVHGLTRNARDFDALAERLSGGVRVICVDVPGRGLSDWLADPKGYEVERYAAQILRLLERLGLEKVDWVGTSMGGLIGMAVAATEKSPIARLVLNDVGPLVPAVALGYIRTYLGLDLSFPTITALDQHLRTIHAGFGKLTDAQWRHLALHSARRDGKVWRLHYDPQIRVPFAEAADADIDMWEQWDRITCPCLVLRGAESPLLLSEVASAMASRGPRAKVEIVPGAGHAPALMEEGQIDLVRSFLGLP